MWDFFFLWILKLDHLKSKHWIWERKDTKQAVYSQLGMLPWLVWEQTKCDVSLWLNRCSEEWVGFEWLLRRGSGSKAAGSGSGVFPDKCQQLLRGRKSELCQTAVLKQSISEVSSVSVPGEPVFWVKEEEGHERGGRLHVSGTALLLQSNLKLNYTSAGAFHSPETCQV